MLMRLWPPAFYNTVVSSSWAEQASSRRWQLHGKKNLSERQLSGDVTLPCMVVSPLFIHIPMDTEQKWKTDTGVKWLVQILENQLMGCQWWSGLVILKARSSDFPRSVKYWETPSTCSTDKFVLPGEIVAFYQDVVCYHCMQYTVATFVKIVKQNLIINIIIN